MSIAAVSVGDLVELVWVSLVVTLALVTAFAVAIRGTARSGDLRREGRGGAAALHGTLAGVCYVFIAAAIVAGVLIIALG